jgi:hypothetical protein
VSEEPAEAYFKALSLHLPGGTVGKREKPDAATVFYCALILIFFLPLTFSIKLCLNARPRHGTLYGNGGTAPYIHNLDISWMWVFTLRKEPTAPRRKSVFVS